MLGPRSVGAAPTGAPGLPQVLHDAPAAVLVIDLDRQKVVYANAAAIALTGERIGLPVDVDAWSDAAGLTDLGGQRMSETTSPLSLVAAGVPVAGEPVAVRDAARRGSSLSEAVCCGSPASPCRPKPSPGRGRRGRWSCSSSSRAPSSVTAGGWRCCATAP